MRWLFILVAALLVAGVLVTVYGAFTGAARERELEHQMVAERVIDELERELSEILATEEARPFLHWRSEYVPDAQLANQVAPSRSPLVDLPQSGRVGGGKKSEWLLGWFQLDTDGHFSSPHESNPQAEQRLVELRAIANQVAAQLETGDLEGVRDEDLRDGQGVAEEVQEQTQAPPPQQRSVAIQQKLNRGAKIRQDRKAVAYNPPAQQLDNFLEQAGLSNADVAPTLGPAVDVVVSPMRAVLANDERLVLARRVTIGTGQFDQAVVLDRRALQSHLSREVLGSGELGADIGLRWASEGEGTPPTYRLEHVFAHPFQELRVDVGVSGIANPVTTRWITLLAVLILVLLAVALAAVYRETTSALAHARARTDFVSAVTHELRTPLTSIRMYAEMLESDMVPDETKQRQYHRTIRGEAERLGRLVEQVLTLARLERKGEATHGAIRPLRDSFAELERIWSAQPSAAETELVWTLPEDAADARVDDDLVQQVLTNLIDNAIKFSAGREGPTVVELRAQLADEPGRDRRVRISVLDRGPGVEPRILRKIFEPFLRGERELTRTTKGTGIGLAVVRGLVEERGGRVWAQNREGGGLAVHVELPLQ
jgi:signal transduction histidine kinase